MWGRQTTSEAVEVVGLPVERSYLSTSTATVPVPQVVA
jgi:hypothetical protein